MLIGVTSTDTYLRCGMIAPDCGSEISQANLINTKCNDIHFSHERLRGAEGFTNNTTVEVPVSSYSGFRSNLIDIAPYINSTQSVRVKMF